MEPGRLAALEPAIDRRLQLRQMGIAVDRRRREARHAAFGSQAVQGIEAIHKAFDQDQLERGLSQVPYFEPDNLLIEITTIEIDNADADDRVISLRFARRPLKQVAPKNRLLISP